MSVRGYPPRATRRFQARSRRYGESGRVGAHARVHRAAYFCRGRSCTGFGGLSPKGRSAAAQSFARLSDPGLFVRLSPEVATMNAVLHSRGRAFTVQAGAE